MGALSVDPGPRGNGPARYYRLPNALGTLGFISPISEHFCKSCNRMRLTADGYLRPCLFSEAGVYCKTALSDGASLSELQMLIRQAGDLKPERRSEIASDPVNGTAMSMIGGLGAKQDNSARHDKCAKDDSSRKGFHESA